MHLLRQRHSWWLEGLFPIVAPDRPNGQAIVRHDQGFCAGRVLRLPLEIAPLFRAWLDEHFPLRAAHIMSLVQQVRGGHDYVSTFGERMRGTGAFADLIEKRFDLACKRLGLNKGRNEFFDISRFTPPRANDRQGELF